MVIKRKVLLFLYPEVGGAERMTVNIGKMLDKERFNVNFFIIGRNGSCPITNFIPKEYRTEKIIAEKPFNVLKNLHGVIKREKPDVVFSSRINFNDKILLFRLFFPKTRFIIRCENNLYTFSWIQYLFMGLTYRLADAIVVQTHEMKNDFSKYLYINSDKIHVLENPIDRETIENSVANVCSPYPNNGKKHFLASGRFAYQKGFDLLIEAFSNVVKNRGDVDLYIIGAKDGDCQSEYERIKAIIEDKNLQYLVHCEGFQNNPYSYMKYADCFVLSSRWEGMPNVLVEALYLGTPVAAFTCIPMIKRLVFCKKNGYIAKKEDVKDLAFAMNKAVDMGRVVSSYQGASSDDFIKLFEN